MRRVYGALMQGLTGEKGEKGAKGDKASDSNLHSYRYPAVSDVLMSCDSQ